MMASYLLNEYNMKRRMLRYKFCLIPLTLPYQSPLFFTSLYPTANTCHKVKIIPHSEKPRVKSSLHAQHIKSLLKT